MSQYLQTYKSETICFENPFAYISLTDFGEGKGMIQIHSDWGSYSYYWGSMGSEIKPFLAQCSAGYIHSKLKSCVNYQNMKKDAHRRLDHFMIQCWPEIHEHIRTLCAGD